MGIIDRAVANSVTVIPRPVVRRIAGRYMAGEHLEEAIETIRDLNKQSCVATVDVLGESSSSTSRSWTPSKRTSFRAASR
jgi:proline dehydrogenase